MFLHVSEILFTGGSASVHAGVPPAPLARQTPQQGTPPPPGKEAPWQDTHPSKAPPSAVHAGKYGQQAGFMHPTGMEFLFTHIFTRKKNLNVWYLYCISNFFANIQSYIAEFYIILKPKC